MECGRWDRPGSQCRGSLQPGRALCFHKLGGPCRRCSWWEDLVRPSQAQGSTVHRGAIGPVQLCGQAWASALPAALASLCCCAALVGGGIQCAVSDTGSCCCEFDNSVWNSFSPSTRFQGFPSLGNPQLPLSRRTGGQGLSRLLAMPFKVPSPAPPVSLLSLCSVSQLDEISPGSLLTLEVISFHSLSV